MMTQIKAVAILAFAAFVAADPLDKPALTDNLDYLNQGNTDNHSITGSTATAYDAGMIPSDCRDIANNESLNPADFENWYVTFDDCSDPWVFCRHKDAAPTLQTMQDNFGRLPVGMRNVVKHVLLVPSDGGAYNAGGNILFYGAAANTFDVWLHESSHSVDLQGAITGDPNTAYSSTQNWIDNYNMDPNVADNYAQTNMVENFAQESVVAIFDKVYPGGFGAVQPAWNNLFHQYATVQGDAGNIILQGGTCNRALQNSGPVSTSSTASRIEGKPVPQSFVGNYTNVREANQASTKGQCNFH